jgi:ligand-binding SRPBCC domain-containing protein
VPHTRVIEVEQNFSRPLSEIFEFFSKASNLQAITPATLNFEILTPEPIEMRTGTIIEYRLVLLGIPIYWRTVISVWEPPHRFVDEQQRGPFAFWRHEHSFHEHEGRVSMRDRVEYREPLGWLGDVAHQLFVKRLVTGIFTFRKNTIATLLEPKVT